MGGLRAKTRTPHRKRERDWGTREVLVFPRLERVAPDMILPRIDMKWTERELESLAELASAPEAKPPTEALVRALRD